VNSGSLYSGLLEAVLGKRDRAETTMSASEALARLVASRHRAMGSSSTSPDQGRADVALAEQLDYDTALILYARMAGIACDPSHFGMPEAERQRVERTLISRGVPLDA